MRKRALSGIRLSVKKDESTSPERQDGANRAKILQLDAEHVGTALDLNVSASKVDPFSRPELGVWLNERMDEFDIIVWWRWDRAIRSMKDLMALVEWAQKYEKRLVFCEGPGSDLDFDFTDGKAQRKGSMSMLIANLVAWAAEVESQNISDRVTGSRAYQREHGEWSGGMVPYGFEPERIKGAGRGWTLVHSPETMPVLKRIIDLVTNQKKSLLHVCNVLNRDGVLSPRDAWDEIQRKRRLAAGEGADEEEDTEKKTRLWNTNGLKGILTSRALLGESVFEGRLVRDSEGNVIQRAVPAMELSEWKLLQAAIAERAMEPKIRYEDPNYLLGLANCARCGERMYMKQETQKGRTYTSLSCRSRHGGGRKSCGQPTLSMKYATEIVSLFALAMFGDQERSVRRYVQGNDHSAALEMWKERIRFLKEDWDDGTLDDRDEYKTRLAKYKAKIDEIGPDAVVASGYRYESTGETYNELWPTLDASEQRQMLIDLNAQFYFGRAESEAAERAVEAASDFQSGTTQRGITAFWDEQDVERALLNVNDGRIKKDFKVWLIQTHELDVQEAIRQGA